MLSSPSIPLRRREQDWCPPPSRQFRALHVVPSYWPATRYGGPIQSVHSLCRSLVRAGHEVDVFTTNIDGDGALAVPTHTPVNQDGVNVHYFPVRWRRRCVSPDLGHVLQQRIADYDVVHLHSVFLWPIDCASHWAQQREIPYVLSPRGMLVQELIQRHNPMAKKAWLRWRGQRMLEQAAALHATSALEAHDLSSFGDSLAGIHVIPNGVDHPHQEPAIPRDLRAQIPSQPWVLFLGRMSWKKGLEQLLDAWKELEEVSLVLAGPDDEKLTPKLQQRARERGIADRVIFTGEIDKPTKTALLREASLLVCPSIHENFGNVVVEAMASGCRALVTETVGAADAVQELQGGWVVPNDAAKIGAGVREALQTPIQDSERADLSARTLARFSWNAVAKRTADLYARAVSRS